MTDDHPRARPDTGGAVTGPHASAGGWTGRRTAAVVGALLVVLGSVLAAAGSLGLWVDATWRDDDGFLGTGAKSFGTSGYALVLGPVDMRWTDVGVPIGQEWLGVVELEVDRDVFVGIGAADDVADYLAGVDYDELRVDGTAIGRRHQDGGPAPSEPAARPIWVAYGTGTASWQAEEGRWVVAVLNPDGSRVVDTELSARASVPALRPASAALLVGGLLVLALGGAVLPLTAVRPPRRRVPVVGPVVPPEPVAPTSEGKAAPADSEGPDSADDDRSWRAGARDAVGCGGDAERTTVGDTPS
ncbi:hypothetical protein [Umezawaea sp. Da 62-37]|uniref:hypothetical protein n=1 Tax=Umezawaea sp. Da 62-37 TaxID=3075927 RepID=UPI0028F70A7D|nr:hypothetical protein [Umezawaea sp. Da 62-37]WNV86170.1 hypothetical protein RM788_50010 [Umezawaea sp. Da 62-37]